MEPLFLAVPMAVIETAVFYGLHWPHRHLLPERFRSMLLAKGIGKSLTYLVLTALAAWVSPWLGWGLALGHPLLGALMHVRWCRSHRIDPVRVQPRDQYVRATTVWVEKLIAREEERKKQVS